MTEEEAIRQADALALYAFEAGIPVQTWQLRRLPGLIRTAAGGTEERHRGRVCACPLVPLRPPA